MGGIDKTNILSSLGLGENWHGSDRHVVSIGPIKINSRFWVALTLGGGGYLSVGHGGRFSRVLTG